MQTIMQFTTGSRSYNLHTEFSDFDSLTVFLFEPEELFSVQVKKLASQKIVKADDSSAVEFREYLSRLIAGNPNYVQTLFDWQHNCQFSQYGEWLVVELRKLLVRDKVHNSFMGVASRMYHEYEETGKLKAAAEAMRYLFMLCQLHSFGEPKVFLSGKEREYLMKIRSGDVPEKFAEVFKQTKALADLVKLDSKLGNNVEGAFTLANDIAVSKYSEFFSKLLT